MFLYRMYIECIQKVYGKSEFGIGLNLGWKVQEVYYGCV